ncbi:MAG: FtsX-like permease family protein [Bacteroidales bacterium]
MIFKIAWENVWRNKTRSFVVISAVAVGVFAGVFLLAAINSMVVQRIDSAVNEELSHIQVNNKDFRNSSDIQDIIPDFERVVSLIKSTPGVTDITGRIIIKGIASTSAKSVGVEINGIDTGKEKEMFTLSGKLITGTGSYFATETKLNSVFIGEKLAKELNIIRYILTPDAFSVLEAKKIPSFVISKLKPLSGQRFTSDKKFKRACETLLAPSESAKYGLIIRETAWSYREGSKIIISFLDINGTQTGAAFRVCGIFRTNNDLFELRSLFVPIRELRTLTGMKEGQFHRVIVRINDNRHTGEISQKIKENLPDYEVLNWKEIEPDLAMMADLMQQIYALFMAIILAALAFGIVNTMMMAVLERTKELGMLMAIGMNRKKVFSMIMLESIFLSMVGGFAGMAIAEAVIAITGKTGINLVKYSEGMEAIGYSAHLFPTIEPQFFITTALLIVLTGIFSSIYPARKALKLNPIEAIRTE